jgi:hypothetical protein
LIPKPNISVLIYTARENHPYPERLDLHCFSPVLETLSKQTFRYFELVIVDALYDWRPDYFKGFKSFFPITHVPSSPNLWQSKGRPGLCAQLNKGLAWCDGELVWVGAENNLFPPHFLQTAWEIHHDLGKVPVAWYAILSDNRRKRPNCLHPVVNFEMCDWDQRSISDVDHRARRFVDDPKLIVSTCHHQHHFAYSGIPIELALELNGFDESLDGDLSALDVDLGSRIEMLRGEDAIAMHRDLWLMEPPTVNEWTPAIQRRFMLKCSYAIWLHNRVNKRTRVNVARPPRWEEEVKNSICRNACPVKDRCSSHEPGWGESAVYPFCEGSDRELTKFWVENQPVRDLREDVRHRKLGDPPFNQFTKAEVC